MSADTTHYCVECEYYGGLSAVAAQKEITEEIEEAACMCFCPEFIHPRNIITGRTPARFCKHVRNNASDPSQCSGFIPKEDTSE